MAAQPSKLRSFAIILVGAFSIYLVTNFFTKNDKVVEKTQISVRSSPEIESIPGSIKNNDRYIWQNNNRENI
ncbi:hypothetical protein EBS02_07880 [bacterium]|nr:hypothetical protein [bacterium]